MSETNEIQLEEVTPPPPQPIKRGRGRPKGTIKTEHKVDENYYKRYYLEKTKQKIEAMGKYTCPFCEKTLAQSSIRQHETDKYCSLLRKIKTLS